MTTINPMKFAALISYLTKFFNRSIDSNTATDIAAFINDICNKPNNNDLKPLFDAIIANKFIDAIKEYRTLTGLGLKESKDEIERIRSYLKIPSHAATE